MRGTRTLSAMAGTVALLAASVASVSAQSESATQPTGQMTTRALEAGVERVLDDGAGHDLTKYAKRGRSIDHIAVAPDGTVWLASSARGDEAKKGPRLWPLGAAGMYDGSDGIPRHIRSISFDEGGNLWVIGSHIAVFDGDSWAKIETTSHATTPDGTVWLAGDPGLESWDGNAFAKDLEMVWFAGLATLPDGTLMALGHDGIYTRDGSAWAHRPYASGRRAGAEDGTLWLLDGKKGIAALHADGSRRFLESTRVHGVAAAPDGSVWVIGRIADRGAGVFTIRPSAVASLGQTVD